MDNLDISESESIRVGKSISCFDGIFRNQNIRDMAVITGLSPMDPGLPSLILVSHNMAIHTSFRVVCQVRITPGINKGINPDARQYPQQDRNNHPCRFQPIGYPDSICHIIISSFGLSWLRFETVWHNQWSLPVSGTFPGENGIPWNFPHLQNPIAWMNV